MEFLFFIFKNPFNSQSTNSPNYFFSQLDIKSRFALWNCRNKSTLKFVKKRGCMYICYAVHSQTRTRKLQQVCYRLDRTCDHQADIKMRSHRLLRLDNIKSVASCQQIYCKLWTADLLQVVVHRLTASCELQNWCKLWTIDLMQVVIHKLDASCQKTDWEKRLMKLRVSTILNKKRPNKYVAIFQL
jgi:hypothetical protein